MKKNFSGTILTEEYNCLVRLLKKTHPDILDEWSDKLESTYDYILEQLGRCQKEEFYLETTLSQDVWGQLYQEALENLETLEEEDTFYAKEDKERREDSLVMIQFLKQFEER